MEGWLIFFGIIGAIILIGWVSELRGKAKKYDALKPRLDDTKAREASLKTREDKLENSQKSWEEYWQKRQQYDTNVINTLAKEKSQGFPWLAKAYDDYFYLRDQQLANYLETKPHPALKTAEEHRQIAKERREAEKAARLANYLLDYCRFLAPWLDDYIGLEAKELDEIIKEIHSAWEKKEEEFDEEVKRHYGLNTMDSLQMKNCRKGWIGIGVNLISPIGKLGGIMRDMLDTYTRQKIGMFIITERKALKTWDGT